MDKCQTNPSVSLDLSKAFDTINHKNSSKKLRPMALDIGIKYTAVNWFSSYLFNCKMFVSDNSTNSEM